MIEHDEHCTWQRHLDAGETPPGQSFWGELNYVWCQKVCHGNEKPDVDVTDLVQGYVTPEGLHIPAWPEKEEQK